MLVIVDGDLHYADITPNSKESFRRVFRLHALATGNRRALPASIGGLRRGGHDYGKGRLVQSRHIPGGFQFGLIEITDDGTTLAARFSDRNWRDEVLVELETTFWPAPRQGAWRHTSDAVSASADGSRCSSG